MTFAGTLAFLERLTESRMRLDLAPSRALLALLGRPDRAFRSVIVAGTNGKGSVCAYLTAIARAAGLRVGTYTSPHLEAVTERVAVDGLPLDGERFAEHATAVRSAVERAALPGLTYFEFVTMAALEAFREARVDLAVLEVGLGGRLDTTNACERAGAAISRIDLDHTKILGTTLAQIAAEKAAVLETGGFGVIAAQEAEAETVLLERAERVGLHPDLAGREFWAEGTRDAFVFLRPGMRLGPLRLGLRGEHQIQNAAAAADTAFRLRETGLRLPDEAIARGLETAALPGRLECWRAPDGREVWMDVAHNPGAVEALLRFVRAEGLAPLPVVAGILADKDWGPMLDSLAGIAAPLLLCWPPSPRAWDPHAAAGRKENTRVIADPVAALTAALDLGRRVLITGSFVTVGAVRPELRAKGFVPLSGPPPA
jgi:dihydrofolate synthase/folylpolyglutamate synthase